MPRRLHFLHPRIRNVQEGVQTQVRVHTASKDPTNERGDVKHHDEPPRGGHPGKQRDQGGRSRQL